MALRRRTLKRGEPLGRLGRPGDEPTYHFHGPTRPDTAGRRGPRKPRRRWALVAAGVALGIVIAAGGAIVLLRSLRPPPDAGSARILVPIRGLSPGDRFGLALILPAPDATLVEYQVTAECDDVAPEVVLMLSGDARLRNLGVGGAPAVSVRTMSVGEPWFATTQAVQLVTLAIPRGRCLLGARPGSPGQDGTVAVVAGQVRRRFESSAPAEHAIRLPQLGDEPHGTPALPTLDDRWAAPANVALTVSAGSLAGAERVDTAEPALSMSGELTWSARGFVVPSATWTDVSAERRMQFLLVALGVLIGVCAALMGAVVLEWLRSA